MTWPTSWKWLRRDEIRGTWGTGLVCRMCILAQAWSVPIWLAGCTGGGAIGLGRQVRLGKACERDDQADSQLPVALVPETGALFPSSSGTSTTLCTHIYT